MHATWAHRGCPPIFQVTGARKSIKIFGCVDIYSAKFHYHMDKVFNAKTYINFLEQIIAKYNGKKIFYIQDNAPYHKDGGVWRWFKEHREIIEVFNLPPYSPELNAAEPLWHHTRITGTHNRYFSSENEIISVLDRVFQGMQNDPNQIAGYLKPFL